MGAEPSTRAGDRLTARALWLTAPRTAELREETVPPPGPGEVRVRSLASALSQGTEMLVYRGDVPRDLPLDLPTLAGSFAFPIKYGYAAAGRVVDTGPDVDGLAPGDLVFALHPHQSIFVAPVDVVVPLPAGLDPLAGVFFANIETAVNVLLDAPLRLGETALVLGQGTVGLLVAQLLARSGARVLTADPIAGRRAASRACGVEEALEPGADLTAGVRARTGGHGADVAIEVSGTAAGLQAAIDAVAEEGTVVAVSWYGAKPVTLELGSRFHRGRVRLRSSQVGRVNPELGPRWDRSRRTRLVRELLPSLRLTALISHRIPFAEAPAAFRLVDERPEETVQVVLTYGGEG